MKAHISRAEAESLVKLRKQAKQRVAEIQRLMLGATTDCTTAKCPNTVMVSLDRPISLVCRVCSHRAAELKRRASIRHSMADRLEAAVCAYQQGSTFSEACKVYSVPLRQLRALARERGVNRKPGQRRPKP